MNDDALDRFRAFVSEPRMNGRVPADDWKVSLDFNLTFGDIRALVYTHEDLQSKIADLEHKTNAGVALRESHGRLLELAQRYSLDAVYSTSVVNAENAQKAYDAVRNGGSHD